MEKVRKNNKFIDKLNRTEFSQYSGLLLVLVLLCILLTFATDKFATYVNITNVIRQISITGILAVGMAVCFSVSEIDLSVGSGIGLYGAVISLLLINQVPFVISFVVILILGALVGVFNGYFVSKYKIPSFVVTLAMEYTLRGTLYLITNGTPITGLPKYLVAVYTKTMLGIPAPVWIMLLVFTAGIFVFKKTTMGRSFYAIGGNINAADYAGINVIFSKTLAFVVCGICVAVASVLQVSRLGSAQPSSGTGMEMEAITAACLGGMSMGGGYGSLVGVLAGAVVIGVVSNGMVLLNINSYAQLIVKGAIILIAVLYNMRRESKKN